MQAQLSFHQPTRGHNGDELYPLPRAAFVPSVFAAQCFRLTTPNSILTFDCIDGEEIRE
jgi:hypothetical protein